MRMDFQQKNVMGDICYELTGDKMVIGNSCLELLFSSISGQCLGLKDKVSGQAIFDSSSGPSLFIKEGGHLQYPEQKLTYWSTMDKYIADIELSGGNLRYADIKVIKLKDEVEFHIVSGDSRWQLEEIYTVRPYDSLLKRQALITCKSAGETIVRGMRFIIPDILRTSNKTVEFPGKNCIPSLSFENVPDGIISPYFGQNPIERSPLAGIHDAVDKLSVLIWSYPEEGPSRTSVTKNAAELSLCEDFEISCRLHENESVHCGTQYLKIHNGPWIDALSWFNAWYNEVLAKTNSPRCIWTAHAAIYEVFAGEIKFENGISYSPYPALQDIIDDLPRIANLGYNTLQLMPQQPFAGYTVYDWYDTKAAYGNPEELKMLVKKLHESGMKLILDIISHGTVDAETAEYGLSRYTIRKRFFETWKARLPARNAYYEKHPEWYLKDEKGNDTFMLTRLFDRSNPEWQDFFLDVLKYYVTEFDIDGFRFDAPTFGGQANWNQNIGYLPSHSPLGVVNILQKAQRVIKNIKHDFLWQIEINGPLFSSFSDLVYNYEEKWISSSLFDIKSSRYAGSRECSSRKIDVPALAAWLKQRKLSLPEGAAIKHILDGHGDWWHGELGLFSRDIYGLDESRILFAFFAYLDGALMSFVGSEKGSEDFYRKVLSLRQDMDMEKCEYDIIPSDNPLVLSFSRSYQGHPAVILFNFNDKDASFDTSAVSGCRSGSIYDVLNEESISGEIHMKKYQVRVLQIKTESLSGVC